jgi:GPI-anchor transamidase subunit T
MHQPHTRILLWLVGFLFLSTGFSHGSREEFHEELFIHPLNDKNVLFHFQFTNLLRFKNSFAGNLADSILQTVDEYTIFPRNIGKIVKSLQLEEYHLTLTQGRWWTEKWGRYPLLGAPVGAELSAKFSPSAPDVNWERLTQTLAGVFCGSLGEMSGKVSTLTCLPQLSTPRKFNHTQLSKTFYGILPREIVCTENLTPWTKLLPSSAKVRFFFVLFNFSGRHCQPAERY